jgi:PAS domain S-box-containing protein
VNSIQAEVVVPEQIMSAGPLLLAAFNAAPFGIGVLDPSGRILSGNKRLGELLDRPASDLDDLEMHEISRPDEVEFSIRWLRELAEGEHRFLTTDRVFTLPDGNERMLRVTAWRVGPPGPDTAIFATVTPVPPRAGLVDGRVRKLIENIGDTITLMDADGNLLETSGRYRPILGYPPEFWESRTIFDLLHPDSAARVLEIRAQVLSQPGLLIEENLQVRGSDGRYEPIHVAAVNLLDDPDVAGIVVTSRNIAAEQALLAELAERTEVAEHEAMLRTRLVATVSHELRNPLHAIGGIAELLATGDLSDEMAPLAATMHRQVVALTTVLDDLLDSSRLTASGVALQVGAVALRSLADDLVAVMAGAASGRELSVTATVDPAVPATVQADEGRLRQVLTNLMGNAVKFTDRGSVQLSVALVDPDELLFEVADTGRGIPQGEIADIFDPFVSATNAGSGGGAGLGLSIVRQLVDAMHGTVQVTSAVGEGSVFAVRLPLMAASPEAAPHDVLQPHHHEPVLVVEDNAVNQTLARSQLTRLGHPCVIVGSGEEALEVLEAPDAPRLVLLDFQLPGIDGLETARRLRAAEPDGVRRVVIGVTASAMAADRESCLAAGMDDFLAKPVGLGALGEMLRRWSSTSMSTASTPPVAVEGESALDGLAEELGDRGIVHQLIDTFLGELDVRSAVLQGAMATGDREGLRRGAHALKSSSGLLGMTELATTCRAMEHGELGTNPSDAVAAQLQQQTAEARTRLEGWKAANPVETVA